MRSPFFHIFITEDRKTVNLTEKVLCFLMEHMKSPTNGVELKYNVAKIEVTISNQCACSD